MSNCVEKLPHSCGSVDGLQVFEEDGKFTGYCFRCGTYIPNPYADKEEGYVPKFKKKSKQDILNELKEITTYPIFSIPERGLKEDSLHYFRTRVSVSEEDGTSPTAVFFPYTKNGKLCGYKIRMLSEKRMWAIGSLKEADMFGWEAAISSGAKRVLITEGEFDAIALYQMVKKYNKGSKWEGFLPAVLSLPNGAGGAEKAFTKAMPILREKFKEIVFVPDNDAPGKEAASKIVKTFPDVLIALLPGKDANDCLLEGRGKAVSAAVLFNAKRPKNTRLIKGSELTEKAMKSPEFGLDWPWEGMTKATRGIRRGEVYYIGAGEVMPALNCVNSGELSLRQS